MVKTAYIFPGQGSQFVGMGSDLYEAFPRVRSLFEEGNDILGFPLTDVMFGSGGDPDAEAAALKATEVTQPALFMHSMAVVEMLRPHHPAPDMVAGHSLGEYSALAAVGALSFGDGLRLVRLRGELMADAGHRRPGTMAAMIGLDDKTVERVCSNASTDDTVVQPANYNSPGQVVVSGDIEAVRRSIELAKEAGARRALQLPVAGAFHSPLMAIAREGLAEAVSNVEIGTPGCPVYLNVTAGPSVDPEEIRRRLLDQLLSPVRWAQSLTGMHEAGAGRFVEVGAGKVLAGLTKRTLGRDIDIQTVGTVEDIQGFSSTH